MGWTEYYQPPIDERAEITRLCTWETDDRSCKPIYISKVGLVFYIAIEVLIKTEAGRSKDFEDHNDRFVFAGVFLTSRRNRTWGYKDMEETMGPCEATAPRKLIAMLSPTTSEWAKNWRKRCLENCGRRTTLAKKKLEDGDMIELDHPLRFTDGVERQRFQVIKHKSHYGRRSRTRYKCLSTGDICRISRIRQRNWTKLPAV